MTFKKNLLGWFLDCCDQGPISTLGFGQPEYLAGGRRLFVIEGVTYSMLKVFSNLFRLCGCKTKMTSSHGYPALIIKAESDVHFSLSKKTIIYMTGCLNPNLVYETLSIITPKGTKLLFKKASSWITRKASNLKISPYSLI